MIFGKCLASAHISDHFKMYVENHFVRLSKATEKSNLLNFFFFVLPFSGEKPMGFIIKSEESMEMVRRSKFVWVYRLVDLLKTSWKLKNHRKAPTMMLTMTTKLISSGSREWSSLVLLLLFIVYCGCEIHTHTYYICSAEAEVNI